MSIHRHTKCKVCGSPFYWTPREWHETVGGWICPDCWEHRQTTVRSMDEFRRRYLPAEQDRIDRKRRAHDQGVSVDVLRIVEGVVSR